MRGSRMFIALAILAGVIAFLGAIQFAPVGMFPAWASYLAGAVGLGLTATVAALKREDNQISKSLRSPPPAANPSAPGAVAPTASVERAVPSARPVKPHELRRSKP